MNTMASSDDEKFFTPPSSPNMKQIDYPMDPTIAAAELIEQRKLLKEINIQLNKLSEEKLSVLRRIALSTKKSGTISKVKEKKKQTVGRNNSKKNNILVNKVIAPNISLPNPPVSVPLPPTTASLYNNNNNSTVAPPSTPPFITQLLPFAQQLPISAQQNLIYQHPSSSPLSSPSTIKNSTSSTKYPFSNSNIQDPVMPNNYTPPSSNHSSFIDTQGSMKSTSPTPSTANHSFLNSNTQNTTASNGSTIAATNLANHTPTFSTEHFSSIQYSNNHRLPEIPVTHKELCTDTNSNDRIKHFPKNKGKSLPSTPLLSSQSMHTISDEPTIHSTYNPRKTVPVLTVRDSLSPVSQNSSQAIKNNSTTSVKSYPSHLINNTGASSQTSQNPIQLTTNNTPPITTDHSQSINDNKNSKKKGHYTSVLNSLGFNTGNSGVLKYSKKSMCVFELDGGICNDDTCQSMHFKDVL